MLQLMELIFLLQHLKIIKYVKIFYKPFHYQYLHYLLSMLYQVQLLIILHNLYQVLYLSHLLLLLNNNPIILKLLIHYQLMHMLMMLM